MYVINIMILDIRNINLLVMCNREPQTAQDLAAFAVSVSVTPWSLSIEDDENVVDWLLKKVVG